MAAYYVFGESLTRPHRHSAFTIYRRCRRPRASCRTRRTGRASLSRWTWRCWGTTPSVCSNLCSCGVGVSKAHAQHTRTYLHTSTNHTTTAPGAKVRLTTWADRIGKTLAFLRLQLRDAHTGRLVAVGKHCKYLPMGIPFWDAAFNPGLYPLLRCVFCFWGRGFVVGGCERFD